MSASAAIVNQTLSIFASGYSQERTNKLAEFIAPQVPTGMANGQYKKYDEKNQFQVYKTARAVGGPRTRIEFGASDPFFNCKPQGLEIGIDDHEYDQAGDSGVLNLQQSKMRTLINAAHLGHEDAVFAAVKAAKAATGGVGEWSNAAKDPIAEIDAQIEAIATATGQMPNRIVFGLPAWTIFRNHALVKARQAGVVTSGVNKEIAMGYFLNPAIEIEVGIISKDANKFGTAKAAANLVGAEVLIFFGSDTPDQYDPSFAKTFTSTPGMVGTVKEYRDANETGDVFATDWNEDIVVTAADSGRRITLS